MQDILRKIQVGGGRLLSGVSYAGWGTPGVILDSKEPYLEQSVKSMREIVKTAEDCGVTYCVEAVNRFETCLINTAREALDYVARVDSPNIGVLLDTYHMNIEETSIADAIRMVGGKRLRNFHTGENNRTAPGRGHLDWDEIFGVLAEIGYTGPIVSEPFVLQGGEVGRDIHVFRDLIDDPCEERIDREAADSGKYLCGIFRLCGPNLPGNPSFWVLVWSSQGHCKGHFGVRGGRARNAAFWDRGFPAGRL